MAARAEPTSKPRPQILLVHDFCSSPAELKPLGRMLSRRGFHCTAPLLPGHGEGPGSMRVCTLEDWTEALTETYLALQERGGPIFLIGAGLGANLCVGLAAQLFPRGLVTLGPILNGNSLPKTGRGSNRTALVSTKDYLKGGSRESVSKWRTRHGHLEVPSEFIGLARRTLERLESDTKKTSIPQLWFRSDHESAAGDSIWKHLKQKKTQWGVFSPDSPSRVLWLAPGRVQFFKDIASFLVSLANRENRTIGG